MKARTDTIAGMTLAAAVITYVCWRAVVLDITFDEASTIGGLVPRSWSSIYTYDPALANNHLLNTLLIKLLYLTGSESVFLARLPNVAACLLYLWFSAKLSGLCTRTWLKRLCWLTLWANPFLLDFFSLARGYGLCLAFESAVLYYTFTYARDRDRRQLLSALVYGGLAVLANFTVLNLYLPVLAALTALSISGKSTRRHALLILAGTLALAAVVWIPLTRLSQGRDLWYGGTTGFVTDTLMSLVKYSRYRCLEVPSDTYVLYALLALLITAAIAGLRKGISLRNPGHLAIMLTVTAAASVIVQHILLGTLYLVDRTALFFWPLFVLSVSYNLSAGLNRIAATSLASGLTAALVMNLLLHINLYKTATWFFESHNRQMLQKIDDEGRKRQRPMSTDLAWLLENSAWFYVNIRHDYPFVVLKEVADFRDLDYYIYFALPVDRVVNDWQSDPIHKLEKDTVMAFPEEGVYMFSNLR